MDGRLLDTNVISRLAVPGRPDYANTKAHKDRLGDAIVMVPVMAIAEINEGMARSGKTDSPQQKEMREFLATFPYPLPFDANTVPVYAALRAELWRQVGTRQGRKWKEKCPEELVCRITGQELGIDERDLQIASIAIQYNLILATADRNQGMLAIEQAASAIAQADRTLALRIDDWGVQII